MTERAFRDHQGAAGAPAQAEIVTEEGWSLTEGLAAVGQRLVDLQHPDGSWEAEVIWSPVITAQAVIVQTLVGQSASDERRALILKYFRGNVRPDGGWGLHPESRSYVFVTTVVYIAARLLGASPDDPMLSEARRFLSETPGGALANPQWGRFWLCLLGLYRWEDMNPCPPELFLLAERWTLSPLRFYCHTRYIYLVMAYLSGRRFQGEIGSLREALRAELPGLDGRKTHVAAVAVAASDLHEPPGLLLNLGYVAAKALAPLWGAFPIARSLRHRALREAIDRIRHEQHASGFQSLSPVSGFLDVLALFANDPADPDVAASLKGAEFWQWCDDAEGLRYAGARSISWDTSFTLQALAVQAGSGAAHVDALRRGYASLCAMQAREDPPDRRRQSRDINRGGWSFTDGTQGWPVSDCTAEAVLALSACEAVPGLIEPNAHLPRERLAEAATFILSRQNDDGGFGSYERRRGPPLLERLNPSEMFGRCMTELTYVECTASSIRALRQILATGAPVDRTRLERAIGRGTEIILSRQRADGSWPGFWGINFVYGTLFALEALRDVGVGLEHRAIRKARAWLEGRQKPDGGWGEHFSGCASDTYVEHPRSLVISTAWATLALLHTSEKPTASAQRGGAWLLRHEGPDGDWPRDSVNGVFFGTAMLDYRLYNTYFPAMALAKLRAQSCA